MQAIRFHEYGNPADVLRVEDIPTPTPSDGEVLVRMLASPINPSDEMFVEGRYGQQAEFPAIPGFEGVGVVESSGGGLMGKFLKGKRVAAINRRGGNWAEYAVIPARQAIPIAGDLSLEQAATFFVNPATAVVMTRKVLAVPRGEWLLQSAAASSLGRMIVRLARHAGFRTINVVRRASQVDELKSLGADEVLVHDAQTHDPEALIEPVRRLTGEGVRFAIDPVGGPLGSTLVRCLANRGHLLSFGTLSDDPLSIPPRFLIGPQVRVEGFWLGKWMDEQSLFAKIRLMRHVTGLIRRGVLTTDVVERIPLIEIPTSLVSTHRAKILIDCAHSA